MQRQLSCVQRSTGIRYDFGLCVTNEIGHIVFALDKNTIAVQLQWLNNHTSIVELAFDRVQIVLFAALVVHDRYEIVADVFLFLVAIWIVVLVGHEGGHVKGHLNDVVLPDVREIAVAAIRLHVNEYIHFFCLF